MFRDIDLQIVSPLFFGLTIAGDTNAWCEVGGGKDILLLAMPEADDSIDAGTPSDIPLRQDNTRLS